MGKKKKILISILAVIAVAAIALLLYFPLHRPKEDDLSVVLSNRSVEQFSAVTVTNEQGSYTLLRNGAGYSCKELIGLQLSSTAAQEMAQNSCTVSATGSVRDFFLDEEDYGLKSPRSKVEITYADATALSLEIGSDLPGDPARCYFRVSGERSIYIGDKSAFTYFLGGPDSLAEKLLSPSAGKIQQTALPSNIDYTQGNTHLQIRALKTPYTDGYGNVYNWCFADGGYLDSEQYTAYFGRCMQLEASAVFAVAPTREELSACGLTEPYATLSIQYDGERADLKIGNKENENYYMYKEGTNAIFLVPEKLCSFMGASRYALESRYLMAPPREKVASIMVSAYGAEEQDFLIDVRALGGLVDGQSLSEDTFGGLYQLICSLKAEYPLEEEVPYTETDSIKIIYLYQNGSRDMVELVPYGVKRYAIFLNRQAQYAVRSGYGEKLIATLSQISEGQKIDPTW